MARHHVREQSDGQCKRLDHGADEFQDKEKRPHRDVCHPKEDRQHIVRLLGCEYVRREIPDVKERCTNRGARDGDTTAVMATRMVIFIIMVMMSVGAGHQFNGDLLRP